MSILLGYYSTKLMNPGGTGSAYYGVLFQNMIIYAIVAGGGVSIGSLFLAGILPGILLVLGLMIVSYLVAIKRGYPCGEFPGWSQVLRYFAGALPGLFTVFIILGGILSGIFTATESSAIAVIYTVLVAVLVYRSLDWNGFVNASINAVKTTPPVGTVLFISCAVDGIRIEDTLRSIWHFYLAFLVVLALVTYLPATTLFLPTYFN